MCYNQQNRMILNGVFFFIFFTLSDLPSYMCLSYLSFCFLVQDLQELWWEHFDMPYVPGAHNNTPETLYLIASPMPNAWKFMRTSWGSQRHSYCAIINLWYVKIYRRGWARFVTKSFIYPCHNTDTNSENYCLRNFCPNVHFAW